MSVVLFEIVAGAPLVFHCDRLRANLNPSSCATSHRRSFNLACAGCPIGATHEAAIQKPAEPAASIQHATSDAPRFQRTARPCIRCRRLVTRRIEPGLCISCLNRHAEILNGKNSKGRYPNAVASRLFHCHALLSGNFLQLMTVFRFQAQCEPRLSRIGGGAFITGVFSGRAEFDRWLHEHYPAAFLEDFELGPDLAKQVVM